MKDLYNFEKNLKKKLDEYEFPFDENNWEKASQMIDASRDNKRPFFFYMLSAIALLVTTGTIYLFMNTSSVNEPEKLLAVNDVATAIPETAGLVSSKTSEPQHNIESSNSQESANNTKPASINKISTKKIITNNNTSSKQKQALTKTNGNTEVDKAITANNNGSSTTDNSDSKSNLKTNNTSGSDNSSKSTYKNEKQEKPKSSSVKEIPVVLGSNISSSSSNASSMDAGSQVAANPNRLGQFQDSAHLVPILDESSAINNNNESKESVVTDSLPYVNISDASTLIVGTAYDASKTNSIDSLNPEANLSTEAVEAPYQIKSQKNIVFAEAGATYLFGWNSGSSQEANGLNVIAGLNYLHYFGKNISLGAGIHYTTINNLTNSFYMATSSNYDFGVKRDVTSIKYLELHYLSIPVKIGVNLGKKNMIGAGANLNMLLNSDCRKNKYRTNNSENPNEHNLYSSKKETGYVSGFNPYDIQASLFYRRYLAKGISANVEFFYGLMDIKNNSHFKNNNFERSMGGKLTLCYDLFKK